MSSSGDEDDFVITDDEEEQQKGNSPETPVVAETARTTKNSHNEKTQRSSSSTNKKARSSNSQKNKQKGSNNVMDVRTSVRKWITPYLPPPVVSAMKQVDPILEPYAGPEASISIVSTLLLCFMVFRVLRVLSGFSTGGRAIADEDDDDDRNNVLPAAVHDDEIMDFGDTVVLCGPPGGGKTRLFYHLAYNLSNLPTVMSVRANMAMMPPPTPTTETDDNPQQQQQQQPVRLMDYPGHASLDDPLFLEILQSIPRIIVVVDSTQNVSKSADVLYELFQYAKKQPQPQQQFSIFMACHKSDVSNSKNSRRIKIQIRTELEKLLKIRNSTSDDADDDLCCWWPAGQPLDLDQVANVKLHFSSTSCENDGGVSKLIDFCHTGKI